ncbi:MAG: carboxypeptidase-like regulatory domain-containing protein, partial [Ignavibacteria bacterium]
MSKIFSFLFLSFFLSYTIINAQVSTAQIEGKVTDSDGNVLPNVNIIVKNLDNGLTRGTVTSKSGSYFVGGLQPGKYELSCSYVGYRKENKLIELLIGQTAQINFILYSEAIPLGAVEVRAEGPIFELKRTDVSMPIRKEQISNLPLDTRNIMQLAALAPGIRAYAPIGGRALPDAGALPPLRFIQ